MNANEQNCEYHRFYCILAVVFFMYFVLYVTNLALRYKRPIKLTYLLNQEYSVTFGDEHEITGP